MLSPGSILNNRYIIERMLDRSEFGDLYLARDQGAGRMVSVKVISREAPEIEYQFQNDTTALAAVNHPVVPVVLERFNQSGARFLICEHPPGDNLDLIRLSRPGRRIAPRAAVLALQPVVEALITTHGRTPPLLHRDIRPLNIYLSPQGTITLRNFGIASLGQRETIYYGVTTPGFSPHEQQFGDLDPRSDLYAVGATLYVLLTGELVPAAAERAERDVLVPPTQFGVAPDLSAVVTRLLSMQREQRFENALVLQRTLIGLAPAQTCPRCGGANREAARFCTACKAPLTPPTPGAALLAALTGPQLAGDNQTAPAAYTPPWSPQAAASEPTVDASQMPAPGQGPAFQLTDPYPSPSQRTMGGAGPQGQATEAAGAVRPWNTAPVTPPPPPPNPVPLPRDQATLPPGKKPDETGGTGETPPPATKRGLAPGLIAAIGAGALLLVVACLGVGFLALQLLNPDDEVNPALVQTTLMQTAAAADATAIAERTAETIAEASTATAEAATATAEAPTAAALAPTAPPADPATPAPPSPTPEPVGLEPAPGTRALADFQALERQYTLRHNTPGGETFDRGNRTKNIWLGGRDSFTDGDLFIELQYDTLRFTLPPQGETNRTVWFPDKTEVGQLGGEYLVQLDVAFEDPNPHSSVGIAFDIQDATDSAVVFEIYNDQHWQLETVRDGQVVPERSTGRIPDPGIGAGPAVTSLWVVRTPSEIQLWIAARHVASLPPSDFGGGFAGIAVTSLRSLEAPATIIVDNFRVRSR